MVTQSIVPRATGQWFDSADGQHWWFDSGSLALDFAYTGAMEPRDATTAGQSPRESLHAAADLDAWLADRFPGLNATCSERELTDAKVLRRAIARLAVSASAGVASAPGEVDIINLFAATPDIPPALEGGSRQAGRGRARATQALSSIARDAVHVFGPDVGGRIRECSADDCSIVYLDTSRGGSRRWCSMQRCGNRAKVRAHRAREADRHSTI
ncbi:CGNR zinc finger domain-containing protein [Rathayibacter soli]|uniref:CGNR zinc finger domain-containing protein n=1 Tax=Rathayibacter soli TaxID=3144168 RepID=UPI0027E3E3B0|nr:CGNR zinc finger domain-containing protein [Glaciibacter superstes]